MTTGGRVQFTELVPLAVCMAALCAGGCGGGSEAPAGPSLTPPGTSRNMTLLAHLDGGSLSGGAPVQGSGCWGYTAPDGRRFALVGTSGGLSIVEVSQPSAARRVGFVPGEPSTWREVKTYRQY